MSIQNVNVEMAEAPIRAEVRHQIVHLVEYSHYPRRDTHDDRRVAYTQDRSKTGLGLDLPEAIAPGELLRVTLRDIDGAADMDGLARVVWCRPLETGRARAGLSILRETGEKPMMRIHKSGEIHEGGHASGSNRASGSVPRNRPRN